MAVLLEAANNEYLYRSASVPAFRSCTITGWALFKGGTYHGLCSLNADANRVTLAAGETNITLALSGGGSVVVRASMPDTDDWVFFACIHSTGTYKAQADAVVGAEAVTLSTLSEDYWAESAYTSIFLGQATSIGYWNGALAGVKVWSAVLSEAEIESDQFSEVPVKTTDLWAYYPLDVHTDLTDHGATYGAAGGRDLTASGTLSTEPSDPPWTGGGGASPGSITTTITL